MAEFAALIEFPIPTRRDPQSQEGREHLERDKTRTSGDYLAVVNRFSRRQSVFEIPRHDDRGIVLDVFGQPGFAPPFDRLAQAWHSKARGERGAKASFVDEAERTLLAGDAPRR